MEMQTIVNAVHQHFLVDMKPPGVNGQKAPYLSTYHGTFQGQPSVCAIGLFDDNKELDGCWELMDRVCDTRPNVVLEIFEPYLNNEDEHSMTDEIESFLYDIQDAHDEAARAMTCTATEKFDWVDKNAFGARMRDDQYAEAALTRFCSELHENLETVVRRYDLRSPCN